MKRKDEGSLCTKKGYAVGILLACIAGFLIANIIDEKVFIFFRAQQYFHCCDTKPLLPGGVLRLGAQIYPLMSSQ